MDPSHWLSESRAALDRTDSETMGSNPPQGMDARLF
jgi:hypothetical protein